MKKLSAIPHIVIVGGGAGGLELATQLGKKLGKKNKAHITLIDSSPTHVWKPLLHEIAAGTLNSHEDELNYLAYASTHYFQFRLGSLEKLNRHTKTITLSPILDNQQNEIAPSHSIHYDILVLAVGSVSNDFGTKGARENCFFLDNRIQADYFQQHLVQNMLRISYQDTDKKTFSIAVVGAGATGVELIAELHSALQQMSNYGLGINPKDISLTLIEAADRVLPALPPRISNAILKYLKQLGVRVLTSERVSEINNKGLLLQSEQFINSNMTVWAAGIKAADFLRNLDGLKVNQNNQLMVKQTLQTTEDENIFAFGDCASCPQTNSDRPVPPRAQAAHQQATFLVKALYNYLNHKPLPLYQYRDFGSLVSLGDQGTVGNLMSRTLKSLMLEGLFARFIYWSLYKMHQTTLFGKWRVMMLTLANMLSRATKSRLKLH